MRIEKALDDGDGAADHSHGTAEGEGACVRRGEGNDIRTGFHDLGNVERWDDEDVCAAAGLRPINRPADRNARFHREAVRLVVAGADAHGNFLETIHYCRQFCGGCCSSEGGQAGESESREREAARDVEERQYEDERPCEAEEEDLEASFSGCGEHADANEGRKSSESEGEHREGALQEATGGERDELEGLREAAGEEECEGAEGERGEGILALGKTGNPPRERFRRAEGTASLRNNVEHLEREPEHDDGNGDIEVPRYAGADGDGLSEETDESSEDEVGGETAYVEVQHGEQFSPCRAFPDSLVVLCGDAQEEAAGDGEAARRPCDEADEEDPSEGDGVRCRGGDGCEIECTDNLVQREDDNEGSGDMEPFFLWRLSAGTALSFRGKTVARFLDSMFNGALWWQVLRVGGDRGHTGAMIHIRGEDAWNLLQDAFEEEFAALAMHPGNPERCGTGRWGFLWHSRRVKV